MSMFERFRAMFAHRDDLVGINRRNVGLVYPNNARRHYPEADDKLLAKSLFQEHGVPVPRTLAICDGSFAVAPVVNTLLDKEHFVVKPASGSGGAGILVVKELVEPGLWLRAGGDRIDAHALAHHIAETVFGAFSKALEDRCFVEERVVPHPIFDEMWKDGLCDLRIITLQSAPAFAMVRVPTHESRGRANLHQGGLGLAIDLASGRTVRALHRGVAVERHPESGAALVGIQLPQWDVALDVARRAAGALHLGYLGVDIVVDEKRGPLVLEVNARPGLEIQNVHGSGLAPHLARAAP